MSEYADFQEIAHCGGQATINVVCDGEGKKAYSVGFRHSSPGPASIVGIYALRSHGLVIADFLMGGVGQGFEPPLPEGCIPVFLGSDSRQCWGHQCARCQGYFRNGNHPAVYPLSCPYCGLKAPAHAFLTPAQRNYVRHYVNLLDEGLDEEMEPATERELVIDMDAVVKQASDQPRPDFYYSTESQQTRHQCVKCGEFNDIRGRYGYCASCGYRNNLESLKASFEVLRKKLNAAQISPEDAVRSAVAEFDANCRDVAAQVKNRIPMKPARQKDLERFVFHDIESPVIASLKQMLDIDLLRGIDAELKFLRMMIERRHIFEHNAGVADDRYVRLSGDPNGRAGVLLRETRENAHRLIGDLTKMLENFDTDFHEIFQLTKWPVEFYRDRQERIRQRQDGTR
jgi:predicted  nucleic acid-binding Zn-ribbon protein